MLQKAMLWWSACLLLLLLCAAALSQTYNDFKKKHILPENGSRKCDDMMKNVNGINQCKRINTFINQKAEKVKALCKGKKNEYITHKFDVIDCKMKSVKPCKYKSLALKGKKKKVKCENGLPVHLEQGIYDNFHYDSEN
uniref:Ribonuclease A-domain domain-containing protein n=1 Tax=Neolamprologus brichardi TaxID=32507 RepID=A0A3Q4HDW8_NEOBR